MQGMHPQHFPLEDPYIKVPLFTTLSLPLISRTRRRASNSAWRVQDASVERKACCKEDKWRETEEWIEGWSLMLAKVCKINKNFTFIVSILSLGNPYIKKNLFIILCLPLISRSREKGINVRMETERWMCGCRLEGEWGVKDGWTTSKWMEKDVWRLEGWWRNGAQVVMDDWSACDTEWVEIKALWVIMKE